MKYFDFVVEAFFVLDIILKFFVSYVDDDTGQNVTDLPKIAWNYFLSFRFAFDILATFPMYLIISNGEITKIIRLIRLPKAVKLFDSSKFEALVEFIMKSNPGLKQSSTATTS